MIEISDDELINTYLSVLPVSDSKKLTLSKRLNYYFEKQKYTFDKKIEIVSSVVEQVEFRLSNHENIFYESTLYLSQHHVLIKKAMAELHETEKEPQISKLRLSFLKNIEHKLSSETKPIFRQLYSGADIDSIHFDDSLHQNIDSLEEKLLEIKKEFWFCGRLVIPESKVKRIDFGPLRIKYFFSKKANSHLSLEKQVSIINTYYDTKSINKTGELEKVTFETITRTLKNQKIPNYHIIKYKILEELISSGKFNSNEIADIMGIKAVRVSEYANRHIFKLAARKAHNSYDEKDFSRMDELFKTYGDLDLAYENSTYGKRSIRKRWIEKGFIESKAKDYSNVDFKSLYMKNKGNKRAIARDLDCNYSTVLNYCSKLDNLPKFESKFVDDEVDEQYKKIHAVYVGKPLLASQNSEFSINQIRSAWKRLGLEIYPGPLKDPIISYYSENPTASITSIGKLFGCNKGTVKSILTKAGIFQK